MAALLLSLRAAKSWPLGALASLNLAISLVNDLVRIPDNDGEGFESSFAGNGFRVENMTKIDVLEL
jgi:hypothetical protein